jgi:hypothetical protein
MAARTEDRHGYYYWFQIRKISDDKLRCLSLDTIVCEGEGVPLPKLPDSPGHSCTPGLSTLDSEKLFLQMHDYPHFSSHLNCDISIHQEPNPRVIHPDLDSSCLARANLMILMNSHHNSILVSCIRLHEDNTKPSNKVYCYPIFCA